MATATGVGSNLALLAHLLRRAGFGATRDQLEALAQQRYEAVVDELLRPSRVDYMPDDLLRRYHMDYADLRANPSSSSHWVYRMVTTSCHRKSTQEVAQKSENRARNIGASETRQVIGCNLVRRISTPHRTHAQ